MADLRASGSPRHLHAGRHLRQAAHLARHVGGLGAQWLARQEAAVLVALLVVLLALFGFVKIAEELGEGELAGLDEWLLRLLRVPGQPHTPIGPAWLVEVAQDITVALLTTFVVGASRVYLGVHYPSDVLAGWSAGLIWALTCWLAARYLQYRGTVDRAGRL